MGFDMQDRDSMEYLSSLKIENQSSGIQVISSKPNLPDCLLLDSKLAAKNWIII